MVVITLFLCCETVIMIAGPTTCAIPRAMYLSWRPYCLIRRSRMEMQTTRCDFCQSSRFSDIAFAAHTHKESITQVWSASSSIADSPSCRYVFLLSSEC